MLHVIHSSQPGDNSIGVVVDDDDYRVGYDDVVIMIMIEVELVVVMIVIMSHSIGVDDD